MIAEHLASTYGIAVEQTTEIEPGGDVFRVDRADGPAWIARAFHPERTRDAVEADAAILRHVEAFGFPAERCAHEEPVSTFGDRHVLVTELVPGVNGRPDRSERMYRALGELHGRLQVLPVPDGARPAGGWHHLSRNGGTRLADVEILRGQVTDERLLAALATIDDDAHLPQALLHPDLAGPNVMTEPGGDPVVIDWTGAGRGARVSGLGQLLFGAFDALHLVDAMVAGYRTHVEPTADELDALPSAVRSFPIVLDAWTTIHHPGAAVMVVNGLDAKRRQADAIANRAREAFAGS